MNRSSASFGWGIFGAGMAGSPVLSNITLALFPLMAFSGLSGYLAGRFLPPRDKRHIKDRNHFILPSDITPAVRMGKNAINIGYTLDSNEPVNIANDCLTRHLMIVGQSGVGKTVLINWMLWQQMVRGNGFMFIDAKLDYDTLETIRFYHYLLGIEDKLKVINIANPKLSNTYNPIVHGEPNAKADRLINLIPNTSQSAGADFYKQTVAKALISIFNALDSLNFVYTFQDLSVLLTQPERLEALFKQITNEQTKLDFDLFLAGSRKMKKVGDDWIKAVDPDKINAELGGMVSRIMQFGAGKLGQVFNTVTPDVDIFQCIRQRDNIYVMLPTMEQDNTAHSVAQMMLSDLRSAVAKVQLLPKLEKPNPPYLIFADEMGSYAIEAVSTLFEQARSAGICMIPAFQGFSQLDKVSESFGQTLIQNVWTKVFFKFGEHDNAEKGADIIGKHYGYIESLGVSSNNSEATPTLEKNSVENTGSGHNINLREEHRHIIDPDAIKNLKIGESVVMSGSQIYHLKTPFLSNGKMTTSFTPIKKPFPIEKGKKAIGLGELHLQSINDNALKQSVHNAFKEEREIVSKPVKERGEFPDKVVNEVYNALKNNNAHKIKTFAEYQTSQTWKCFMSFVDTENDLQEQAKKLYNDWHRESAKQNALNHILEDEKENP